MSADHDERISQTPSSKGKRSYKRVLLIGGVVLLMLIAWPLYVLVAEHVRVSGTWIVLTADGKELPGASDRPVCLTLNWPGFSVNPFCNPKRINFQHRGILVASIPMKGIYQWEGNRLRLAESSGDLQRPTSFDPHRSPSFETNGVAGSYFFGFLRRPLYPGEETVPVRHRASEDNDTNVNPIDFVKLRREVATAAREAFTTVRSKHPGETFYAFALCPDVDVVSFFLAANSEEGLRRTAEQRASKKYPLEVQLSSIRWDVGAWDFGDLGNSSGLKAANEMIHSAQNNGVHESKEAFDHNRTKILATFVEALKDLDSEGFFGKGIARENVTVIIQMGDTGPFEGLELTKQLNPAASYERYAEAERRH